MPPITTRDAQRTLLRRLLDGYERSRCFGKPPPWPRDVIVKLDAAVFPSAFAPDGREELEALRAGAEALASAGAARLVRAQGWSDGEARELRLGPAEVAAAYALGATHGLDALGDALAQVGAHAARLAATAPGWMGHFLEQVDRALARGELAPLGMSVERFKRDWRELCQALTAAAALARGQDGWERVVSEAIFGDSKRLAELRGLVAELLVRADPRWDGVGGLDAPEVLEAYGVRRKPGLIVCAGGAELCVGARTYALHDFQPVAHLPEAWGPAWLDGLVRAGTRHVTTVENEYPFLAYVEERGGPARLAAEGELVVYTGGFPPPALVASLGELARRLPELALRHFGDADLGGVRIWWHLRRSLDRPIALHRVDRAWLDAAVARRAGTPLRPSERQALARLRRELDRGTQSLAADVRQALALIDGLVHHGMKVEQEREG